MAPVRKRSTVWQYFDICKEDAKFAVCSLCQCKISRGGEGKKAGTSAMKNHVKNKHAEITAAVPSTSGNKSGPSTSKTSTIESKKQLILEETMEQNLLWDAKAETFHYLIAEMIALDNEPLSIVERVGFTRLMEKALPHYKMPSRSYIAEKIIPDIYERIHAKIEADISKTTALSVTSDIWTCLHNNASFLSFTAHWLSPEFKHKHAVLAVKPFTGSHTGENIANELNKIADGWNIPQNKIHLVVHDSGANMIKGVRIAEENSAKCFIHSLQRVVNESLRSQPEVVEMIAAARRIATHFNHSGLAQGKLEAIQVELKLPVHKLVQDVSTRWNSTYYLLERLLEQKCAVSLYTIDHDSINNLTAPQWELLEECIKLLKPFEEITKITSSGLSCISEVIPHVATLKKYLGKAETAHWTPSLSKMRASLKAEIEKHFELDDNYNYLIATLIDPRFKTSFLGIVQAEKARQKILLEELKMSCDESSSGGGDSPPCKRRNTDDNDIKLEIQNSFLDCFNEVATDNNQNDNASEKNAVAGELDFFLKTARMGRNGNPYVWWSVNANQYPVLSTFAKKYLSAPCSSVYSEKLFSEPGLVYENKRSCLLPTNTERLVLIHHNLPLVDFKY